jgi:hypothetical protein
LVATLLMRKRLFTPAAQLTLRPSIEKPDSAAKA